MSIHVLKRKLDNKTRHNRINASGGGFKLAVTNTGVNKSKSPKNVFGGKLQKNKTQRQKHHIPDFASMVSVGKSTRPQDSSNRPYDEDFILGKKFTEAKELRLKEILLQMSVNANVAYAGRVEAEMKKGQRKPLIDMSKLQ